MGKRGVLAAAFLAMAVGLAGADGPAGQEKISCTCDPTPNKDTGKVVAKGDFSNFPSNVKKARLSIWKVVPKAGGGEEITYIKEVTANYDPTVDGGSITATFSDTKMPSGTKVRAFIDLYGDDGMTAIINGSAKSDPDTTVP